ncbi:hypothetical protein VC83_09430 [Pseudogymnoascus destructans]|uniref:Uncharacterized protein n=1 Tax=Pseudogymnoascus destructans TaxID=655981 RepID=A0A176ZYU4_9PEZI|nr:uncharacterized protein VC83_09430 [Pseudogymnoascus destructans]OAF54402.2 hypothetical protein VC83_09430 [Pseudogymnoascus destructans]
MPVPPPAGALSVAFRVLCLHYLRAKAQGVQEHACVWSPSSSKCEYCTGQHSPCVSLPWFLDEEYRALVAAEAAVPVVAANVVAATAEANRVALVAAQSVPKFRSAAERDSYEEARAMRAAIEAEFAQIRSSLRRLRTEHAPSMFPSPTRSCGIVYEQPPLHTSTFCGWKAVLKRRRIHK